MTEWKQETKVQTEPTRFGSKRTLVDYINYCIKYNVTKNKPSVIRIKGVDRYFTLITGNNKASYPLDFNLKGINEEDIVICE